MAHSKANVLIHLVWATWQRARWIDPEVEAVVRAAVAAQAQRLDCPLLAFGAADDHVHVVLGLARTHSLATVARALKGGSSHEVLRRWRGHSFRWQEGYGAFSISERDPAPVVAYVTHQRERHRTGLVDAAWEQPELDREPTG